ncbi:MAG: hypothetical protein ACHRHE_13835 [Tepidisphaerales bacterium]
MAQRPLPGKLTRKPWVSPYATYAALIQSGRITTSLPRPTATTDAIIALVDNY